MTDQNTAPANRSGAAAGPGEPTAPRAGNKKKNHRGKAGLILLILLLLAVAGTLWMWSYLRFRESTDDAQIDGTIHPVACRVGGPVRKVHVRDNQKVDAGALLLEIDPRDYQIALDRAAAELAAAESAAEAANTAVSVASITTASQVESARAMQQSAEARVTVAVREVETARARIASLQARLREAEAQRTKAAQDLERMQPLVAKDEISRLQFDGVQAAADATRAACDAAAASIAEAENAVVAAEARLHQARAGVSEARAAAQATRAAPDQVSISKSNAAQARARVLQARAALDRARLDMEYTRVLAPAAGTVSMKKVEVGQVLQRDQLVMAIVPLENVWVTANFKEDQLRHLRIGQPVKITVDAYGGRVYQGRVESLAAATGSRFSLLPPENASGNYVKVVQRIPVKIMLEAGQDPEHLLRPGMSVIPTIFTQP